MDNNGKITPMLRQYLDIKAKYREYILFYRLGDFYEMFYEDAVNISRELELTLTSRADTPMCGVPHHSCEIYIKRLVDKGYKIAVCEQVGTPNSKGLVEREVVRIITPGTLIEDSMLDESRNNFIACFYSQSDGCGAVFADLSTGELHVVEKKGKNTETEIIGEISRYTPVELLFNSEFLNYKNISAFVKQKLERCTGDVLDDKYFSKDNSAVLLEQFKTNNLASLGLGTLVYAEIALMALMNYFIETQKNNATRFINITVHTDNQYMNLGLATRRNLELVETMRNKERRGSLVWVLDKTKTSMGRRKLRQFIERPLTGHAQIIKRLEAVEELTKNIIELGDICGCLSRVYDIERLMTRIVYKAASPRDIYSLGKTCAALPDLKKELYKLNTDLLKHLNLNIDELSDIANLIENAIKTEPPALMKDGGYINDGFNDELDRLRNIRGDNNTVLKELEDSERIATGIKTLKVGYNRVFGYYIEVSKGAVSSVPDRYIRKQTLTNGERYITEELKKIENEILSANDKILALEAEIFAEVRDFINEKIESVQRTAESIAMLDVICSFANTAIENSFIKPEITLEDVIEIKDGRHPVIEKILNSQMFTPNDTFLDLKKNRLIIITGPNMAGKSTYMRQVAIITLMAQIGCFVPAKSARIGVVDKIFTRVGASDDLTSGQSTFMVEMSEVSEILKNATSKSLVILDEIGRGTSTFDGISIAKAVAEYINSKAIGCKTLFATHYHELISLERKNQGIRNFSVAAIKKGDELQFLHKVTEGGVDESYGIEVAKLAGLPNKVIQDAKAALKVMELNSKIELDALLKEEKENSPQINFSDLSKERVINAIKNLDIDSLSPMEALQKLLELKKQL